MSFSFVLLHHTDWPGREDHYDLMLQVKSAASEDDHVLRTFSTLVDHEPDGRSHSDLYRRKELAGNPNEQYNLFRLNEDHRYYYLSYEGELSQNRGKVRVVDKGSVLFEKEIDPEKLDLAFSLKGKRLKGPFRIRHMGAGVFEFEKLRQQRRPPAIV